MARVASSMKKLSHTRRGVILGRVSERPDLHRHPPPGADLETKWGGADGPQPAHRTVSAAQSTRSIIRKNAEHLSSELDRTAELLEKTVAIAEQHARRRERAGDSDGGREERRAAERARKYAQRARSQAEEWRKLATRTTG